MRRLAPLLGVLALSVGVLFWAWGARDAEDSAGIDVDPVSSRVLPSQIRPETLVLPPPPTAEEELAAVARRARALLADGRADEAVALLTSWRERLPGAFDAGETSRLLESAKAAVEAVAAPEVASEAGRDVVGRRFRASHEVAALAPEAGARARLQRHVDLFVPRPGGEAAEAGAEDTGRDWLGGLYEAQVTEARTWAREAPPLAVADAEGAEARRMAQLRRLAARGATELLEPVHGALLWLALHQGEDGGITDRSVLARCEVLGHGSKEGAKTCLQVWGGGATRNDTAATALALLAFLDFRDQDAKEVFEPTVAQATRWLVEHQGKADRIRGGREFYVTAISMMALAQAAASADSTELRAVVAKGLERLYAMRGPYGGYRYLPKQEGDVSVTGWVAQAVEAARAANVTLPEGMEDQLRNFLDRVWALEHRFLYVPSSRGERSTLFPVGMLTGHILWHEPEERILDTWRTWLKTGMRRRPQLYTLYYGLRMSLLLEGGLSEPWRAWVGELAAEQVRMGGAAGLYAQAKRDWVTQGGCVVRTALATLTLEHALHER